MKEHFVVGPMDSFPAGSHPIIEVGGRSIGVYNVDGNFYAIQNICPHALAPICMAHVSGTYVPSAPGELIYGMEGRVLRCPWHGWEYDIATGEALFGMDRRRLATYPVSIVNDHVVVTMRPRGRVVSEHEAQGATSKATPEEIHERNGSR